MSVIVGPYGLGLIARLRLIRDESGLTNEEFAAACNALGAAISRGQVNTATQPTPRSQVQLSTIEAFAVWLAKTRGFPVTATSLETTEFRGRNAPAQFRTWIRTGVLPPQDRTDALPDRSDDGVLDAALARWVDQIAGFLAPGIEEEPFSPVQLVVVDRPAPVRAALADLICKRAQEGDDEGRPVLYLPVGARSPLRSGRPSYADVVSDILAFCKRAPLPGGGLRTPGQIEAAIAEIRRTMARSPFILILDGWTPPPARFQSVHALIADDGVAQLLTELSEPRPGPDLSALATAMRFNLNRIVVIADREAEAPGSESEPILVEPEPAVIVECIRAAKPDLAETLSRLGTDARLFRDDAFAMARLLDLINAPLVLADVRHEQDPYAALVAVMSGALAARPEALLALRWVALSDDGVRLATLETLLVQWRDLLGGGDSLTERNRKLAKNLDSILHAGSLERALGPLVESGVLIRAPDAKIGGLDDIGEDAGNPDSSESAGERVHYSVPSLALREEILRGVIAEDGPDMIIMQRLLAEQAISQHTRMARHGDWDDTLDARYYRRLVQALFHGFASVATGPGVENARLRDLSHRALPASSSESYNRLYAVLYRALMEMPPRWELSRVLGREDLKFEILLLAMNADAKGGQTRWSPLYGFAGDVRPRRTEFLDPANAVATRTYLDQLAGLARSAYHRHDIETAQTALDMAVTVLDNDPGWITPPSSTWSNNCVAVQADFAKIAFDLRILTSPSSDLPAVEAELKAALVKAGLPARWLSDLAKIAVGDRGGAQTPSQARETLDGKITAIVSEVSTGVEPVRLVAWSDMLCRLGEVQAHRPNLSGVDLYRAFILFFAAERFRRLAFDVEPLGRAFYINGHSTRVMVRVALRLVLRLRENKPHDFGPVPPDAEFFLTQARRHLDMLTRYLSRYPTERASLLIAEARYIRVAGHERPEALAAAERMLSEADDVMSATLHRPRVRMRLLLERSEVYALSIATRDDAALKRRYARAAVLDLNRLEASVERLSAPHWAHQVRQCGDLVRELCTPWDEWDGAEA